jgi:hypothetical protein
MTRLRGRLFMLAANWRGKGSSSPRRGWLAIKFIEQAIRLITGPLNAVVVRLGHGSDQNASSENRVHCSPIKLKHSQARLRCQGSQSRKAVRGGIDSRGRAGPAIQKEKTESMRQIDIINLVPKPELHKEIVSPFHTETKG